jgi:organic radical activating enzyme
MYRVNEIFYSLQGEGFWTGTPMVFLRLSGCNLQCPFCDTDHSAFREMTEEEIVSEIQSLAGNCRCVCITGGEPSLQLDGRLTAALHRAGFRIHLETNGTRTLPEGIDWITVSPKADVPGLRGNGTVVLDRADEVKVVFQGADVEKWLQIPARSYFLQPCSGENTAKTVDYILRHPLWRLSLQTHKYLNIR